ncbi:MAG: DUF4349 domain-containing protein [Anaerolineae bacterium]|nr:DUF4349 domain-containing protein [Anaerolineae bacterium]
MKKQSDKKLAKELAARLDAGVLEPTDEDSAEMQDLLATCACLEGAVEEPDPGLQRRVKRSFQESGFTVRVSAWVERVRERWLAWLPRRYHPVLAGVMVVTVVLVAASAFLRTPHRLGYAVDNGRAYNEMYGLDVDDSRHARVDAPASSVTLDDGLSEYPAGSAPALLPGRSSGVVQTSSDEASTDRSLLYEGSVSDVTGGGQAGYRVPTDVEGSGSSDDGRMVVRRASLTFVVEDAEESFERVQEIAAEHGGGVYSLETGKTSRGSLQTFVSIQVPVAACDQVLAQLRGMDAELLSEQVTSQDVTAEYVDLDARVRNLELAEQELQELLEAARERGEKAQGILSIYDELVNIRQQIEQLKGQMTLLQHSAAMARIDVALIPQEVAPAPPGFDAGRVLREAWEDVVHIFEDIATFFIRAFAYAPLVLPLLLVVALVVWLVVRRVRRCAAAGEGDGRDE